MPDGWSYTQSKLSGGFSATSLEAPVPSYQEVWKHGQDSRSVETRLLGFLNLCSLRPRVESLMKEGIPSTVHQVQDGEALVTG